MRAFAFLTATFFLIAAVLQTALAKGPTADTASASAVGASDFRCIRDMHPVRGFYVDNLRGQLAETLAVAHSPSGGTYPPGSVVQLVPTEVMVKLDRGASPATGDWEFFELDVSGAGSTIRSRGFTNVVNRFGGNCLECHAKARPEWDLICEQGHGCDPIPLTPVMVRALQKSDPRCAATPLDPEEQQMLDVLRALPAPASR